VATWRSLPRNKSLAAGVGKSFWLRIIPDVAIAIGMMVLTPDREIVGQPIGMVATIRPAARPMIAENAYAALLAARNEVQ
jgi:hypothetical protein